MWGPKPKEGIPLREYNSSKLIARVRRKKRGTFDKGGENNSPYTQR